MRGFGAVVVMTVLGVSTTAVDVTVGVFSAVFIFYEWSDVVVLFC
jgi:hypothetical protein